MAAMLLDQLKPQLPPMRAFRVRVVYNDGRSDDLTVYAHTIQFLEHGLVAFFEMVIENGEEKFQMRRVFKDWLDVEELIPTQATLIQ